MSQHLVVKQSSVADVWPPEEASWQRSHSHKPVARLTMVLTWPQPHNESSRRGVGSEIPTFFTLAATIGFLLAFAIVLMGTNYLDGVLLARIQSLPHYNQPQAQYSDLGKWQGHR
jgi:hypothetical protein